MDYDAAHDAWWGQLDWPTQRNLESDTMHRFWDVSYRIDQWREEHGNGTPHEAILRKEAVATWKQLTDEERAYLEDLPRYASYGQAHDDHDRG